MTQQQDSCGCNDVCNLPTAERDARLTMMRTELLPQAVRSDHLESGAAWEFHAGLRSQLEELVLFERECCPGLDWEVSTPSPERVRLQVTGLPAGSDVSALLGSIAPTSSKTGGSALSGILKSAGLGVTASFVLFCVVPIGLLSFGGGALAGAASDLDNPYVIGAGAVLFGSTAWFFDRRRRSKRESSLC